MSPGTSMSHNHQPVRLAVIDGSCPEECNPWNAELPLKGYERLIEELTPTIPSFYQSYDQHRFRVAWDSPSELETRAGEAWNRFVGVLVDAVGAENQSTASAVEKTVLAICERIVTESAMPAAMKVGLYVFILVSDQETQFQADLSQAIADQVNLYFSYLPAEFRVVRKVSDPRFLIKALEAETTQLCRNLRSWKVQPPAAAAPR